MAFGLSTPIVSKARSMFARRSPAFGLSTPIVTNARLMLARRSPASTMLDLVEAAVARSRAEKRAISGAIFAEYIFSVGEGDKAQWVLGPLNLPVEAAAELAISCARDCLAFIQNVDFRNDATLQDAEKHLRGVLNAVSLLNSLVLTVPSSAFARRLFGQDLSHDVIVLMLRGELLHAFLFRLAQRERVSSQGEKTQWTEDAVVRSLVKLSAAALVEKSQRNGVMAAFELTRKITEEHLATPFRAAIRVLDDDQYEVSRLLHHGLLELAAVARETYLSGDMERACQIDAFAHLLKDAYVEANIGISQNGRTVLHTLLSMSTGEEAFELWQYLRLGTVLAEAKMTLQLSDVAEDLIGEFVSLFGDREVSSAHDPAFWNRVAERCEAMNFQNVAASMALVWRAAKVQPESALARAAKALCAVATPDGEPKIVLQSFLQELINAVVGRMQSRYHPTQSPLSAAERWKEQSILVLRELYDALPSFLRRRAFQERLFEFANLHSEAIDPQWNVRFFEAYETINAYIAEQHATGKDDRREHLEPRAAKRRRKELGKQIER